jgi:hypothetical protein
MSVTITKYIPNYNKLAEEMLMHRTEFRNFVRMDCFPKKTLFILILNVLAWGVKRGRRVRLTTLPPSVS